VSNADLNPIPEVPSLVEARVDGAYLVATTEDGRTLTFAFEAESDRPGLVLVDREGRETTEEQADDWLQALVVHPVADEWLSRVKREHPDAYREWFTQASYDEGGEEGSG
jgi:hypothetical protein